METSLDRFLQFLSSHSEHDLSSVYMSDISCSSFISVHWMIDCTGVSFSRSMQFSSRQALFFYETLKGQLICSFSCRKNRNRDRERKRKRENEKASDFNMIYRILLFTFDSDDDVGHDCIFLTGFIAWREGRRVFVHIRRRAEKRSFSLTNTIEPDMAEHVFGGETFVRFGTN